VNEIDERWLARAPEASDDSIETWLRIGRHLGSLERADKVAVTAIIGERILDEDIVDLLCSAGRYDCVLTSDPGAAILRSRFLTAPVGVHRASWGKDPLYLLPMFLSRPVTAMDLGLYNYGGHLEALDRFKELRSTREPDLAFPSDFSRQAFEPSCKIDGFASDRKESASHLLSGRSLQRSADELSEIGQRFYLRQTRSHTWRVDRDHD
jgi:hypothetical protein